MERPVKERLVGAAVLMAAAVILIPEMLSGPDREATGKAADAEGAIKTYTIDLSQSPGATSATSPQETETRAPPPEEMPTTAVSPAEERPPEPQAQPEPTPSAEFSTEGSPASASANAPAIAAEPAPSRQEPLADASPRPEPRSEPPPRQIAAQPARAEAPPQSPPQARSEQTQARVDATPQPKPQAKPELPAKPVASTPTAPTSAVPAGKQWAVQLGSYSSETTAQRLVSEWRAKGQNAFVMPVKSGAKTLYRVRIGPSRDRASAEAALKSVKASIPGAAVVAHP